MTDGILSCRRVLVVAPHGDDEVLGCGGLILSSRSTLKYLGLVHIVAPKGIRRIEAQLVQNRLDVDTYKILSGVDGQCAGLKGICIRELALEIQMQRPDVVLCPHRGDDHPDHRAAWEISWEAVRMARYVDSGVKTGTHRTDSLFGYEVWSPIVSPTYLHNITDVMDAKLETMRHYESQMSEFPYCEYITALNGWRGMLWRRSGFAEAFETHAVL